jgi:Uma2 family endonuclease
MAMPHAATDWTVEMVHALPEDGKRYEIIDGELFVNPAPRLLHQAAVGELYTRLREYCHEHRIGVTLASPADIVFGPRTLVQPDVFVSLPFEGRAPREWSEVKLLLAVEILSPSSQRADRMVKRRLFQRERVPEYWIVDLDARLFSRWRPEDTRPEEIDGRMEWAPAAGMAPLVIELPEFFEGLTEF